MKTVLEMLEELQQSADSIGNDKEAYWLNGKLEEIIEKYKEDMNKIELAFKEINSLYGTNITIKQEKPPLGG